MVLRIWLVVLILSTGYYASRIYGETLYPEGGSFSPHLYKLNHDD